MRFSRFRTALSFIGILFFIVIMTCTFRFLLSDNHDHLNHFVYII